MCGMLVSLPLVNGNSKGRAELPFVTRGPFLESPGNFSGLKSILIQIKRIKPGNQPVHFVLLNDTWISPDYCKRDVQSKQQQLSGSVNYWDFRETGLKDKKKNDCPLNVLTDEYGGVHRNAGFYVLFAGKYRPVCDFIIQINERSLFIFQWPKFTTV